MIIKVLSLLTSSLLTLSVSMAETPCSEASATGEIPLEFCEPSDLPREKDIFTTLKRWFDEGENVIFEEIKGSSYSGRCYRRNAPDTPEAAALAAYAKESNIDNGPAFPKECVEKVVSSLRPPSINANFFDGMSASEVRNLFILGCGMRYCLIPTMTPKPSAILTRKLLQSSFLLKKTAPIS